MRVSPRFRRATTQRDSRGNSCAAYYYVRVLPRYGGGSPDTQPCPCLHLHLLPSFSCPATALFFHLTDVSFSLSLSFVGVFVIIIHRATNLHGCATSFISRLRRDDREIARSFVRSSVVFGCIAVRRRAHARACVQK